MTPERIAELSEGDFDAGICPLIVDECLFEIERLNAELEKMKAQLDEPKLCHICGS